MKALSTYKLINKLRPFVPLMAIFCTILFSCTEKNLDSFSTDLAIDRRNIIVPDTATTTKILVYADGNWSAKVLGDATWVKLDPESSNGKGQFFANVESNVGNLPRFVKILLSGGAKTDTIYFRQKGIASTINIVDPNVIGIENGGAMKTSIVTNVPFNLMSHAEVYDATGGTDWISGLSIQDNCLNFTLAQNTTAASRQAVLRLTYLDGLGTINKDSITITQNTKGGYANAVLKDFAYVKNALTAGAITEDIYIEGVVVSDKGNPNMGLNANLSTNKHVVDKTENSITSYIQSLDGKSGIRIRSKSAGDNIFVRNEKVKIWLKGATLKKETLPSRVTIDQLPAINIISKTPSAAVAPREIYMKDLTDNDVYTYVKLKQVEISVPSGSFTNINEGYGARTDMYPTNIRDIDGNSMYMMTNLDVSYRRNGIKVPQGSGDIAGILVHEEPARYGGNIGKYQIRHLTREDINLKDSREDGFSKVLVEWSRFKTENLTGATDSKNPLTPDTGTGTLTQSQKTSLDFTANGIFTGPDYNGLLIESTTVKGAITDGAWGANNWWDNTKNIGASWLISTSTAGITKPISIQIECSGDIGGPTNFMVEWSTTGTDAGTWNLLGEYTCQDMVNWTSTLLTQVPGFKVVNFQFPIAASGLNNLYIRLRVKNKTVGTSTGPTGGTLAAAGVNRLAHLSIKYNK
jgi:hypothetical protein